MERPILFRPPLVRAILDGHKTQTRRPAKDVIVHHTHQAGRMFCSGPSCSGTRAHPGAPTVALSPFGAPGNRLWVRETWAKPTGRDYVYAADGPMVTPLRWKPSIHMPRDACRLILEITDIRLEMLQCISEADAHAEGTWMGVAPGMRSRIPVEQFRESWDRTYAKTGHGWDANPWVWVITFRRVTP